MEGSGGGEGKGADCKRARESARGPETLFAVTSSPSSECDGMTGEIGDSTGVKRPTFQLKL